MKTDWKSALAAVVLALVVSIGAYTVAPDKVKTVVQQVGAVTGPDILSQYFSVGGQREWHYHPAFLSASSTLCGIQSPAASTTITAFNALGLTGPYAYEFTLSWGATQNASTTILARGWAASDGTFTTNATTSIGIGGTTLSKTDNVIPPSTWLIAKIGTTSATAASATFAPTGYCGLTLQEL